LQLNNPAVKNNKWIKFNEVVCSNFDSTVLANAAMQKVRVLCTRGLHAHPNEFVKNPHSRNLKAALDNDVLVVLTAGYGTSRSRMTSMGDLHQIYPNVIWVTECNCEGRLLPSANEGELVMVL
jgi:hypothetical protein